MYVLVSGRGLIWALLFYIQHGDAPGEQLGLFAPILSFTGSQMVELNTSAQMASSISPHQPTNVVFLSRLVAWWVLASDCNYCLVARTFMSMTTGFPAGPQCLSPRCLIRDPYGHSHPGGRAYSYSLTPIRDVYENAITLISLWPLIPPYL